MNSSAVSNILGGILLCNTQLGLVTTVMYVEGGHLGMNIQHADLMHVEISIEMGTYLKSRYTCQWIYLN